MKISYRTRQLEQIIKRYDELERLYGAQMARLIAMRIALLEAINNLGEISEAPPEKCRELTGRDKGRFSVRTTPRLGARIIFAPDQDPVPCNDDGSMNRDDVTDICILEIKK